MKLKNGEKELLGFSPSNQQRRRYSKSKFCVKNCPTTKEWEISLSERGSLAAIQTSNLGEEKASNKQNINSMRKRR